MKFAILIRLAPLIAPANLKERQLVVSLTQNPVMHVVTPKPTTLTRRHRRGALLRPFLTYVGILAT